MIAARIQSVLSVILGIAFVACEGPDEGISQSPDKKHVDRERSSVVAMDTAASRETDQVGELLMIAEEAISLVRTIRGDVPAPELIGFRQLERLLPREVEGLPRTSTEAKANQVALFSSASAMYADASRNVTVFIADLAPLSGLARLAFMDWQEGHIDRESDRGYERTRPLQVRKNAWPAYEKFQVENGHASCTIQVWVAGRFFVGVEGDGFVMDVCEETLDDISFAKLEQYAAKNKPKP